MATGSISVVDGVAYSRIVMVNVFYVGTPDSWVLVDAGLYGAASHIEETARALYGGRRPQAIVLTHGHFDHVGALKELAHGWDVPIYAHRLEFPYLDGRSDYPPPDPTVGGGAMARLSFLYPRKGIDVSARLRELPADGRVPGLPEWRWVHTPGHTPGHVSLFRDRDRTMIAGDAFVTTRQESAYSVAMQKEEVNGPPMYFTPDWVSARRSVEALAALRPEVAATGHGRPMRGETLRRELQELAAHFEERAMPAKGRYVREPAVADESGVVSVPPPVPDPMPKIAAAVGLAALGLYAYSKRPKARTTTNISD